MCLFSVACRNDDAKSNSKQTPKNKYVFRAMEPKQCSSGKLFRAGLYNPKGDMTPEAWAIPSVENCYYANHNLESVFVLLFLPPLASWKREFVLVHQLV